jgi:hypothetical protein
MGGIFNKNIISERLGYRFGCHLLLFYINEDVITYNK